jgi:hypothetical protein
VEQKTKNLSAQPVILPSTIFYRTFATLSRK